jgi:hypothetical protein
MKGEEDNDGDIKGIGRERRIMMGILRGLKGRIERRAQAQHITTISRISITTLTTTITINELRIHRIAALHMNISFVPDYDI